MSELAGKSLDQSAATQEQVPAKRGASTQPGGGHDAVLALQRTAGNGAVARLLGGSSGKPLDAGTREAMESKFGEDFGKVRVHTGEAAARAALGAGARAFTSGRDIVFGDGFYSPSTTQGTRLLVHELAHVIQQSRSGGRTVSPTAAESEARQAGASAASGQTATVQAQAGGGAQADPLTEEEVRKQIADNEASVANATTPQDADALFKEREALQQQLDAAAPAAEAPSAPPPPAQVQAPPAPAAPAAAAPKVEPFDPQAGNPFVKWLLYRNDTPVLDALTNDQNLKVAQDVAAGVAITAGTIATGGLLAEAAAGAGAGAITAGAIGGAGGSTASVALKSAYKQELPTAQEAITEIGVGTLTGGVGGGLGGAAAKAGLGKIASGAIGGAGGAATQTAANAAITGKAPTATEALKDVAVGAAFGGAFSAADTALGKFSGAAEPIPLETVQNPAPENAVAETQAPVQEAAQSPVQENAVAETEAPVPPEATPVEQQTGLSEVPPEIDQAVEQGIIEEPQATDRPSPRPRPQRPAARGAAAEARENFADLRGDYAADLNVAEGGQVHHSVELQALDKYPGVYSEGELNAAENMRGIPPELQGRRQLHNSKVREILDRHYRGLDAEITARQLQPGTGEYNGLVRDYLASGSREVDWALEPFFSENRPGASTPAAAQTPPATRVRVDTNSSAAEPAVSEEPPQGRLRIENGQVVDYGAQQSQAETTAPETNVSEEPPQGRLRIENGQVVDYGASEEPPQQRLRIENGEVIDADSPRVRVDTTPKQIRVQPEPAEYSEPEEQSSEPPLKKRFLRRDLEDR